MIAELPPILNVVAAIPEIQNSVTGILVSIFAFGRGDPGDTHSNAMAPKQGSAALKVQARLKLGEPVCAVVGLKDYPSLPPLSLP